jgi:hypothetical protein
VDNSSPQPDHLTDAMRKLKVHAEEWQNVFAFIRSCYGCRVQNYDLDAATRTLENLAPQEQHAVIMLVLAHDEAKGSRGR